jgi:hypothetical protein
VVREANTAASKPASHGGYSRLLAEVHAAVRSAIPRGRTVLVVSRGDEQLVRLDAHRGWHFPRHQDGRFAGFHPESSEAAIAHLEDLRSHGAEYLVFPETSRWWLDYYGDFREHLDGRYRLLTDGESCLIYDVSDDVSASVEVDRARSAEAEAGTAAVTEAKRTPATPVGEVVGRLLPPGAKIAVLGAGSNGVDGLDPQQTVRFEPGGDDAAAVTAIDQLPARGVEFLVVPRPAYALLDMRPSIRDHLLSNHRFVTRQRHVCEIYELLGRG